MANISPEIIQKAIDELSEISEREIKLYLEKIIDFLKWTTTIALGAFLWIGTNYQSFTNILLLNMSLASFGLSIILSFAFFILILDWMNSESKLTLEHKESLKMIIPGVALSPEASEQQNKIITRLLKKYDQLSKNLTIYKYLIGFHGVCLIGGILCFILTIIFK